MIKLLLADDEEYTREGLIEEVPWSDLGIQEVKQARNGDEAISIAKWYKPDIILTDVRMPKLNGIEFAEALLNIRSDVKIIFMSGFMEVDYLKSAIRLSAIDYIEKPIDIPKVNAAIKKAVDQIMDSASNRDIAQDKRRYDMQKLMKLLLSQDSDAVSVADLCADLEFPTYTKYSCIIVGHQWGGLTNNEINNLEAIIKKRSLRFLGGISEDGTYTTLIAYSESEQYLLSGIYADISLAIDDAVVAVGMPADSLTALYLSGKTAQLAFNESFFDKSKSLFIYESKVLERRTIEPQIFGDYQLLLKENPLELKCFVDDIFEMIYRQRYYRKEQLQGMVVNFILSIANEYPGLKAVDECFASEEKIEGLVAACKSSKELEEFFYDKLKKLEEEVSGKKQYSRLVSDMIDYIDKNFQRPEFGVAELAENFYLTPSYINLLFKQETGITLKKYIGNVRLDKAKLLVRNEYVRIGDIADQCGYSNANYFARVFKDELGMTPMEYRKMVEN